MTPATDTPDFHDPLIARMVVFLRQIGLEVRTGTVSETTPQPGIRVEHGALVLDEARMRYPGDLLHEAGHLAVAPPQRRAGFHLNVGSDPTEEMMAIAWSYAAARHLGIDPAVVFHKDGYLHGSPGILEAFGAGRFFGAPMLDFFGMTYHSRTAMPREAKRFPHMLHWLRQA